MDTTPDAPFSRAILAVLAGGRSSRFGSSKLLVSWRGEPILAWHARGLRGWADTLPGLTRKPCDEAWLNLPAESTASASSCPPGSELYSRIIHDAQSDAGPLAGIAAIFEAAGDDDLIAIVPADMPLITRGHLARLSRAWLDGAKATPAIVMSRWSSERSAGRIEPLPSLWHVGPARALVAQHLARGDGPSHLAQSPRVITIPLDQSDAAAWGSINTPSDLTRLSQL